MSDLRGLYLDPFSGIAGDMLLGLMIDLGVEPKDLEETFTDLNLDHELGVKISKKNGITATDIEVGYNGDNEEISILEVLNIVDRLDDPIKEQVKKVFQRLAKAEANIHGKDPENIHFHEVGAVDAIIEIVGVIKSLEILNIDKVYCGEVSVGTGFVKTKHGKYPAPAPASAELLKNIPIKRINDVNTEIVTPTGTAILKEITDNFGDNGFRISRVGYGAGDRDLSIPNILRGFLIKKPREKNRIALIETNIDDMNNEFYGYLMEKLFDHGALDVYFTPIQMKKNRPATEVSVMASVQDKDQIINTLLSESSSIGVKVTYPERVEADRDIVELDTDLGSVKVKIAKFDSNIVNIAPEYEDCKEIAKKNDLSLKDVYQIVNNEASKELGER